MYYTTVLAIVLSTAALLLIAVAAVVGTRGRGDYWSGAKHAAFWSPLLLAGACVTIAIIVSVTSMTEARKSQRGLGDGPRFDTEQIDGRPVDGIAEMADNFPNVATKCVWDGWRGFVTSNGDHLAVVRDESCEYTETGPS